MVASKSGKDLIDQQYREYAMYVLEQRAIPSCIDGLKPTARKLICAGLDHAKNKIKVAELGGMLSRYSYHHGEASAQSTLVGLAQDWNNNVPLFTRYGNFGSRMIQEAAAARYIFVKLSDDFNKYFCDFEVCPKHYNEEAPEPQTYLPNIPWVLINGTKGIAVGFATDIQPRDPQAVIDSCLQYIKTGKAFIPNLKFPHFKGEIKQTSELSWQSFGKIEKSGRSNYVISELPWGYDRETYYNFLTKLEEENKIDYFTDECDDSGFRFEVKVSAAFKAKVEADPVVFFKLVKNHNENLTTLDENGRLKLFKDASELIAYFCDYRIVKIADKIKYDIEKETIANEFLKLKRYFIQYFLDNGLQGVKKKDMEAVLQCKTNDKEVIAKIVSMPFYSISEDSIKDLENKINESDKLIKKLSKLDPKKVFVERLESLKV